MRILFSMRACRAIYKLFLILVVGGAVGCTAPQAHQAVVPGALFQYATLQSLIEGHYDGELTLDELRRHGDFGIGTFNALDGEMILIEGCFYRVGADGRVTRPLPAWRTPFACVLFFEPHQRWELPPGLNYETFQSWLDERLGSLNYPIAVRVAASFDSVDTRSVPAQTPPYPRLPEVTRQQPMFHFSDVSGQLVGFRLPAYIGGLNVAGYHLHFLTDDLTGGGHLLNFVTRSGWVEVDSRSLFTLQLPSDAAFGQVDLADEKTADIHAVERQMDMK